MKRFELIPECYNRETMPDFISGLELCGRFYAEAVRPILDQHFPALRYSAAVIGWGSEVLGYDTERSTDHHWGPRLLLFLSESDLPKYAGRIDSALAESLPQSFLGYSTNFGTPDSVGVRLPAAVGMGKVDHMVQTFTIKSFFKARLGIEPFKKISVHDWLTFPQQRLLELTSGKVYHDELHLERVRQKFAYYPHDLWLYMLAARWKKISQEEAFVGRTNEVGDELGSRLIAARLVREIVLLCFLMERRYAPYSKWLGSAFRELKIAKRLLPILLDVTSAEEFKEREANLSKAYSIIASAHIKLGITKPLPTKTTFYFGRPYRVIHGDAFADEIRKAIKSSTVRKLNPYVGSVDQFTDSTDVVSDMDLCGKLQHVYR